MNKSLKVRLLLTLVLFLSFAWLVTIGAGYFLTEKILNRQLDLQLEQVADSLSEVVTTSETRIEIKKNERFPGKAKKGIEFQIWRDERIVSYSLNAPKEILSNDEGYSQNEVASKKWRVFSTLNGDSRIVVGQDLDVRKSLIRGMILSNLWPMIVALPLIALILWFAVTSGLAPLAHLAAAIKKRSPEQLSPIDLGAIPSEVTPVVQSLNNLLEVVDKALEREKQFTDNAAHELRTPLSAIKTQAQVALRSTDDREIKESLVAVNQGADRASRMIGQLLTLARLEPENLQVSFSSVDLRALTSQVIARFVPQALAKNIDIGMNEGDPVKVRGNADFLELLISNIIDNAVRYSPQHGIIDVKVQNSIAGGELIVEDNGPGIPEKDRQRVFDRFVRLSGSGIEGSGIGLAIVKKIVNLHQGKIKLESPKGHSGLIVQVNLNEDIKRINES